MKLIIRDLEYFTEDILQSLCWNHIRNVATSFGLKTKVGNAKNILNRLQVVKKNRFDLGNFMVSDQYSWWFKKGFRGPTEADKLGVFRFPHVHDTSFEVNQEMIFKRFAGRDASRLWEDWNNDGTIVVPSVMSWLVDNPSIYEMILEEVNMYLWHRRKVNGQPNLGWLRSAFFSQIQQIARQDPVYYALVVATNPQKNWRQISFPYYMKAVLPGDYIFFQHIDINVPKYIECARGANRIQTSLTLSEEHKDECTYVIPGFHKNIVSWWSDVTKRYEGKNTLVAKKLQDHRSNCLKTSDCYSPADIKKYGKPVPALCGPGDIRISRPEIMHGSGSKETNGIATQKRIVVNPWFVGIQEDHSTLDVPESGSWEFLAACHRDLCATKATPSGQVNVHGLPPYPFPASVPVRGISALSDALVGLRRWDDPIVLLERDLLLGEDDESALIYVEGCRRRAQKTYRNNMKAIRELEKKAFGANSYYRLKEQGQDVDIQTENENVDEEILEDILIDS